MDDFDYDVPTCYICGTVLNIAVRCTLCDEINENYIKSLRKAKEKSPNACDQCLGCGSITESHDPSPSGISLSAGCMYDTYECPICVEKRKCPRCGSKIIVSNEESHDDDALVCTVCAWNSSDTNTVLPASPW